MDEVAEDHGGEKEQERSLEKEDAVKEPTPEKAQENDPASEVMKKESDENNYELPGTDDENSPKAKKDD